MLTFFELNKESVLETNLGSCCKAEQITNRDLEIRFCYRQSISFLSFMWFILNYLHARFQISYWVSIFQFDFSHVLQKNNSIIHQVKILREYCITVFMLHHRPTRSVSALLRELNWSGLADICIEIRIEKIELHDVNSEGDDYQKRNECEKIIYKSMLIFILLCSKNNK